MFAVEWTRVAATALVEMTASAADPDAVVMAAARLHDRLALDPENVGESRPFDQRVEHDLPVGVRYEVFPDARRVVIVAAWVVRKTPR